jgi:preprotein translocase subunit SecF
VTDKTTPDTPDGDRGAMPDETVPDETVPDETVPDETVAGETAANAPTARPANGARGTAGGVDMAGRRRRRSIWTRLYHGETNVDFVGRRKLWFTLSLVAVLIGIGSLLTRDLNLGIDFEGGVVWQVAAGEASVGDARDALDEFGLGGATIQELESDEGVELRVEAEPVSAETSDQVTAALADLTGSPVDDVNLTSVGPSWGEEISEKALRALIVFLVLVTIYIALRFELKMAIPTLVALVHDVLITLGVYSVTQLEVTPATVIAVLTILGYSIYDGIVVFDKVDENTRLVSSTGGLSYAGMVNVSLNQALMRSLNTTITALLPVASLLIVGAWIMGAMVLQDFAIALLIGLFSGAYSSIFIASPLLAWLKEREPRYRDIKRRVDARGGDSGAVAATVAGGGAPPVRVPAAAVGAAAKRPAGTAVGSAPVGPSGRAIPPRPRKKTKTRRR